METRVSTSVNPQYGTRNCLTITSVRGKWIHRETHACDAQSIKKELWERKHQCLLTRKGGGVSWRKKISERNGIMDITRRFVVASLVAAAVGMVSAQEFICSIVTPGRALGDGEYGDGGACTGSCGLPGGYLSCPSSDSCSLSIYGTGHSCFCNLVNRPCFKYAGGAPNLQGCCSGGAFVGLSTTSVNVASCWLSGGCKPAPQPGGQG